MPSGGRINASAVCGCQPGGHAGAAPTRTVVCPGAPGAGVAGAGGALIPAAHGSAGFMPDANSALRRRSTGHPERTSAEGVCACASQGGPVPVALYLLRAHAGDSPCPAGATRPPVGTPTGAARAPAPAHQASTTGSRATASIGPAREACATHAAAATAQACCSSYRQAEAATACGRRRTSAREHPRALRPPPRRWFSAAGASRSCSRRLCCRRPREPERQADYASARRQTQQERSGARA